MVPEEMLSDTKWTIAHALRNKAIGSDGVFSKPLALSNRITALIVALRRAVGRTAYAPRQWRETVLVPLDKGDKRDDPTSFRPIVLLSDV